MKDLFGHEIEERPVQMELGGPTIHAGRVCVDCGRGLVETPSGFMACPKGHGKLLLPAGARRRVAGRIPVMTWTKVGEK